MPNNQLVIVPPFPHVIINLTIDNIVYAEFGNIRGMTWMGTLLTNVETQSPLYTHILTKQHMTYV